MPYENTPILLNPEQARRAKADHPGARELTGRPAKIVMDDWSVAKAREDCIPFTFELHSVEGYGRDLHIKAQEKFVKGLNTLMAKQAREAAKRAKLAAKVAA